MARFGICEPDCDGSDATGQDSSTAPGQLWGYDSHRHECRAVGRIGFGGCSEIGDHFRPVDRRARRQSNGHAEHPYLSGIRTVEQRAAFRATISNFLTRACIAGSFVVLMLLLSRALAILSCLASGIALLVCLTYLVARNRGASVTSELIKHIALAAVVIVASGL